MWDGLGALGTVVAALIALGVWGAEHRTRTRAQAEKVSFWPVVLRRADEVRGEAGSELDDAHGFIVRNDSNEPIWKLTISPASTNRLPVAVLPPGTFFVYTQDVSDEDEGGPGVLFGPAPVFTQDDDGRLYLSHTSGRGPDGEDRGVRKYEVVPPSTPDDEIPPLTFADNRQRGWTREAGDLNGGWRRNTTSFAPLEQARSDLWDALTKDEAERERRRERRQDVGTFMREFATQCAETPESPAVRGAAVPAGPALAALGVIEVYLQGGAGMGVQLRTVQDDRTAPMYYLEGSVSGQVPRVLSYGTIVKGGAKKNLLGDLRHPRGIARPTLEDWLTPRELYEAVLEVIARQ